MSGQRYVFSVSSTVQFREGNILREARLGKAGEFARLKARPVPLHAFPLLAPVVL